MANNQIALQSIMPDFGTPEEREARQLKMQALRDEAQLAKQARADDTAIRDVYRTTEDPAERVKALYRVNPKAGMGAEKAASDLAKEAAETDQKKALTKSTEIEAARKKVDAMGQMMGFVMRNPTPEAAERAIASLEGLGLLDAKAAGDYRQRITQDPAAIKQLAEEGFTAAVDAKDQLAKIETRNLGDSTQTTATDPITGEQRVVGSAQIKQSPDSVASNATTRRGQDFQQAASLRADTRAKEANENGRGAIIQTDTGPMLANTRTGATRPIIGPDGKPVTRTKPLTEFQGKSAAFGDRAMAADAILNDLGGKYSPGAINAKMQFAEAPIVGGVLGAGMNRMLSDEDQKAEQAQRDFINATLRQESGAAIGANEFANAKQQYFPQPGDSQAVIKQKAQNRKLVIEGFKRSAGANADFTDPAAPPPAAGNDGWTVTEVN